MNNTQVARTFKLTFSNQKEICITCTDIAYLETQIRYYEKYYASFVQIHDAYNNTRYGYCGSNGIIVWFYKHLFTNNPTIYNSYKSPPPKKVIMTGTGLASSGTVTVDKNCHVSLSNIAVSPDEVGMVTVKTISGSYIADQLEQQRKDIQEFTQRVKEQNQRLAEASAYAEHFSTQLKSTPTPTKEQSMKFEQRYYLNGNNIEHMDDQEIDAVLVFEEKAIEELKARKFQTKRVQAMIKQREEELAGVIKFLDDRFDAKQAKE